MEFYKDCQDIITDPRFNNIDTLELIIGTKCQNACSYCYRVREQCNGPIIGMPVSRAKMYIDNAIEMGIIKKGIPSIEIFGGDPIVDIDYFKDLLCLLKDYTQFILAPTNGRIIERLKDKDIEDIFDAADGRLALSWSVDSPFQENNRGLSQFGVMQGMVQERDWDRIFYLSKKYNIGFHPMLSFETVNDWYNTWDFFVSNGANCYLLEVRHPMTREQMIEGIFQLAKIKKESIKRNLTYRFNTIDTSYSYRGMSCSGQTTCSINTDGCMYFCHRLINERFKIADFNTKEIDPSKFVMWNGLYTRRNQPICMSCPIREVCSNMCLGAVFEYWGSNGAVTVPIPSVCQYFLLKNYIFSLFFKDWEEFINTYVDVNYLEAAVYGNFSKEVIENLKRRIEDV